MTLSSLWLISIPFLFLGLAATAAEPRGGGCLGR